MINAEAFRAKIKEREDLLKLEISKKIQEVLAIELQKEDIDVPFNVVLDETCRDNFHIVRECFNLLGFTLSTIDDNTDIKGVKIRVNYTQAILTSNENMQINLSDFHRTLVNRYNI